jgi:hypothetical protein
MALEQARIEPVDAANQEAKIPVSVDAHGNAAMH